MGAADHRSYWRMSYKLSLHGLFFGVFVLFVILIPANNSFEVLGLMRGELEYGAWSDPITPLHLKIIKDVFLFLAVLLAFLKVSLDKSILRFIFFGNFFFPINLFFLILAVVSIFSLIFVPGELVFVGVRAYWTLIFVYVGACFYRFNEKGVVNVFFGVFLLHFLLQVAQFVMEAGYPVFGEARNPGLFIVPTTAGAFSVLAYYLAESSNRNLFKLMAIVSAILSTSTIAIIVFLVYFLYRVFYLFRHYYQLYLIFFAIFLGVFIFVFYNLDVVSGRGDGAYQSLYTRIGYVTAVLNEFPDLAFGRGVGVATSQAVMLGMEGAVVADNTFTGLMLNLGWIALIPILFFVLSTFFVFDNKILFFMLIGFSMVANMFEMSPVVQILMIVLGQHAARGHFNNYGRAVLVGQQRE